MQNSNSVTQMCPHIYVSPTSKYQFSERHGEQYHAHGLRMWDCCQASRQGCRGYSTSSDRNPRQGQVTMLRVHSPWSTTKALVMLWFSIMHQRLHHSWILAKSLLREAATSLLREICLLACEQLPIVWSHLIIYHDFLPAPRRGSHVKSGKTHTQSSRYTP